MTPFISAQTIDDLLRKVATEIRERGTRIDPTKGGAREVWAYQLELLDPRARLSRTETRGRAFSCLGELCWILSGSGQLSFIRYYIHDYPGDDAKDEVYGAYGPRLRNWDGVDQLRGVIDRLQTAPFSRKAVVQLYGAHDLSSQQKEIPCTCTLQFLLRDGHLHLIVFMRSNDIVLGLPHDIFCFSMIQEIVARSLGVALGGYRHVVGSLHIYDRDRERMDDFLSEGWQPTTLPMPPMPAGDPWGGVDGLLFFERSLRLEGKAGAEDVSELQPYWADLVRLLKVHRAAKEHDVSAVERMRNNFVSDTYAAYVSDRLGRIPS